MSDQIVIALSHRYCSYGRTISKALAKKLSIGYYDSNIINELAEKMGVDSEPLKLYDQATRRPFITRSVRGHSSSVHDSIVKLQSDFIKECAHKGESFIVVGRCFEYTFHNNPKILKLYVHAEKENRIAACMKLDNLNRDEAIKKLRKERKKRVNYYKAYTKMTWGDARYYDLCINSSVLGVEGTVDFIYEFIKKKYHKNI